MMVVVHENWVEGQYQDIEMQSFACMGREGGKIAFKDKGTSIWGGGYLIREWVSNRMNAHGLKSLLLKKRGRVQGRFGN